MFAVVEFIEGDTGSNVAVVPLSWLHKTDKKCQWPDKLPAKTSLEEFIKTSTSPKTTWPGYKVTKVHRKTGTLLL